MSYELRYGPFGGLSMGKCENSAELHQLIKDGLARNAFLKELFINETAGDEEKTYSCESWLLKQIPEHAGYIGLLVNDIQNLWKQVQMLTLQLNPPKNTENPTPTETE